MKKFKLTPEEQRIEDEIELYEPVSNDRKKYINALLKEEKSKTKPISIRLSEVDLLKIKEKASIEGIKYQTLISSVLHKYVTNRLIEIDDRE